MVLLIKPIHQIDITCLGKILVSLSFDICVFTTQKRGQCSSNFKYNLNFFSSPSGNEGKRERTLEGAVVQRKKTPAVFKNPFISRRQNNNNKYNAEEKKEGSEHVGKKP